MTPIRVQRKRTKGWRMPPDTIYVGRGSKWGNPFTVAEYGARIAVFNYRLHVEGMQDIGAFDFSELRGKNLACWCREDAQYCHADVLLKLANA